MRASHFPVFLLGVASLLAGCAGAAERRWYPEPPRVRFPFALEVGTVYREPTARGGARESALSASTESASELARGIAGHMQRAAFFRAVSGPRSGFASPSETTLALDLIVTRYDVRYVGRNASFWPNIVLWLQFLAPSWFVPDETYSVTAGLSARVRGPGGELLRKDYEITVTRDLDDFDRGWMFLGIWRVPGALTAENFGAVARALQPEAAGRLAGLLLHDLAGKDFRRRLANLGRRRAPEITPKAPPASLSSGGPEREPRVPDTPRASGVGAEVAAWHITERERRQLRPVSENSVRFYRAPDWEDMRATMEASGYLKIADLRGWTREDIAALCAMIGGNAVVDFASSRDVPESGLRRNENPRRENHLTGTAVLLPPHSEKEPEITQRPVGAPPGLRADEVLYHFLRARDSDQAANARGYLSDRHDFSPATWGGALPTPASGSRGPRAERVGPETGSGVQGAPGTETGNEEPPGEAARPPVVEAPRAPRPLNERAADAKAFALQYERASKPPAPGAATQPVVWTGDVMLVEAWERGGGRAYLSARGTPPRAFWVTVPPGVALPQAGEAVVIEGLPTGPTRFQEPGILARRIEPLKSGER